MEIMALTGKLLKMIGFYYKDFFKFPKILRTIVWFSLGFFNFIPMVSLTIFIHIILQHKKKFYSQITFLWNNSTNVYGASEGLSVLPSFCITALKIIFYVKEMTGIREIIEEMQKNVTEKCRKQKESQETFSSAERHLSILTILFLMSLISCMIFYCAIPTIIKFFLIFSGRPYDYSTPFSVQFVFSIERHPLFEIIFVTCASSVFFMAMEMISMDTVFVGLVIYARAHFTDLISYIKKVGGEQDPKDDVAIHTAIRECIIYHKQILGYVERVQSAMSITIFVQYVGSTFLLCTIIFQTTVSTRIDNLPIYVSFLSGCITQLFMYSFYGTLLTDEGLQVAHTIYEDFNWYEYSPTNRKLLLVFMQRAQTPVQLTAMKFFDCSLDTFMKVRCYALN